MSTLKYRPILLAIVLQLLLPAASLHAGPVRYIIEGKITGSLSTNDVVDFSRRPFVITLSADTDSIQRISDGIYGVIPTGVLQIDGFGSGQITEDLHLWCNFSGTTFAGDPISTPHIGLSIDSFDSAGIITDEPQAAFDGYTLDSAIGPIPLSGQYAITGLPTSEIGMLSPQWVEETTFRAVLGDTTPSAIPLPPAVWSGMLMLGVALAPVMRVRRGFNTGVIQK